MDAESHSLTRQLGNIRRIGPFRLVVSIPPMAWEGFAYSYVRGKMRNNHGLSMF